MLHGGGGGCMSLLKRCYCMSSYSRMYARTFFTLLVCCGVHIVILVRGFPRSGVCRLYSTLNVASN
jgi:hypothetical protein